MNDKRKAFGKTPTDLKRDAAKLAENPNLLPSLSAAQKETVKGYTKTAKNLTEKQKLFIKYMGEGDSQTSAAIRAGVSVNCARSQASQWRKIPIINKLIMEEHEKYKISTQMTKDRVMQMQLDAYDMAKLMSEPATMVTAAREIGKMCGFYEPVKYQMDININGQVALERMNTLSDAELMKLISEGAPKGSIMAQEALNAPG